MRYCLGIEDSVRREELQSTEKVAPAAPDLHGSVEGTYEAEIWSAVERIRNSQAMSGCHRLTQLLNFIVESTLRGESMHLKETTIGVFVFGRSPDYDPKVDTIVRSQAWRLRAKLKKYYATEGSQDPVVIELPIGHYVPVFHVRDQVQA
jgi:hypothetical protein